LGVDHVVDHTDPAWPQRVLELTHRAGVDVVFEHVGEAVWDGVLQCLGWGGRLVTCGATTGAEARLNLRALFAKQWQIYGSYMGTRGELLALWPLVERGAFQPVVDRVFALEEAAQAHAYMESRQHFGKVVLRVSE
jgi:NADPH:quinone reductase-like Zn-dependent oxidoreductase